MMKILQTYLFAALALVASACSETEPIAGSAGDRGVLEMKIATRADAGGDYDPLQHLAVRIYRTGGAVDELLRQYTAEGLPERLELNAGKYRVEVEAGESAPASFTKRYYTGQSDFTVTAGKTTPVEVACKRQSVAAEVKFEATVTAAFGTDFHAWMAAAEGFDPAQAGEVPALQYTADGTGYFTLPEGVATLTARFEGTHPERGPITREDRFEDVEAGRKYAVSYKFSKDLPGFVDCILIRVDPSTEDHDDTFPFTPEPSVEGDGFDTSQPQDFIPGNTLTRSYRVSALAPIQSVTVEIDGKTYDALNGATPGIDVEKDDALSLTLTLTEALFEGRTGGSRTIGIRVTDTAGASTTAKTTFRVQGILPVDAADYDLWTNSVTLRALILDPAAPAPLLGLRAAEGTWVDIPGVDAGDGLYTATFSAEWSETTNDAGLPVFTPKTGTGVWAAGSYECRAVIGDKESFTAFTASGGQTIPNGDMEDGTLPCFKVEESGSSLFWASGNNSFAKELCTFSSFSGMGDAHCAKLASVKAAVVGLAAGNLMSGLFYKAGLTTGVVEFGQPYQWQARPTALRVKYHAQIGTVNNAKHGGSPLGVGDPDRGRIFACIVDWSGRHKVSSGTSAPEGVWDPTAVTETAEGKIIGYASLFVDGNTEGDSMVEAEIPFYFYDKTTKPSGKYTIIVSCSANAYGDYMVGCTTNVMYVDDFEWVY